MRKITLFLTMLLLVCVSTAVAQENGKMYKLKIAGTSKYLTAFNNTKHQTGAVGGVGVTTSTTNENAQIFTFTSATDTQGNSGFTLKSNEGRFIKCWRWNVDAIDGSQSSVLIFESVGNDQFKIKWYNNEYDGNAVHNAIKYIKSEIPEGNTTEYVFGDANSTQAATWELEEFTTNTSTVITSVSQLTNNKAYTVTLPGFSKKGWAVNSTNLGAITDLGLSEDASDVNQRFAFLTPDDGETYYLYSVGQSKFVNYSGDAAVLSDEPQHSVSFETGNKENTFVVYFDKSHFINVPLQRGMIIDGWGPGGTTSGSSADDGNSVRITAVADFDPADALSKFGPTPEEFDAKFELLIEYLNKSSKYVDGEVVGTVGYPNNPELIANMNNVYTRIISAGYGGTYEYNSTDYQDVVSLITSYERSTEVKFPENGKAYRIKAKYNDGTYRYIYRTAEGKMQVATAEPSGYDGTFIFRNVMGETYALVNNNGEYMVYYADGKSGVGSTNDGFANQYECGDFDAEVTFVTAVDKTATSGTKDNWLGAFLIKARNVSSNTYFYLMAGDPDFHSSGETDIYYSGNNRSSVFYLEEVTYPNTPKLNAVAGSTLMSEDLQSSTMGTFSAPFATVVPAGVTAYYVTAEGKNNDYAQITTAATEGQAIPANQGVILVGSEAGNVVMLPATTESPVTISNNQLGNTAGAAKELAGQGHYILTGGAQGAGFYSWATRTLAMNKAYLDGTNVSAANAMKLVWNGETTGIETLVPATDVNAPIYDLSGRRVLNTVKGGVYIQNGKKFIVK